VFVYRVKPILFLLLGLILHGVPVHAEPRSGEQHAATPPNIVLIVLDACREDRIEATRNGQPVMPYLRNFPAVRFRKALSSAPWTTPAMVSILSSLYVDTHQVHGPKTKIPERMESAASYLKKAGYSTLCMQTNGMVNLNLGFGRGFDVYDYQLNLPGDEVTAQALAHVANATPPFFLYAHYMDTHDPYEPPPSYRTLMGYPNPGLKPEEKAHVEDPSSYIMDNNSYVYGLKPWRSFPEASETMKEALQILYDSAARFVDEQSGMLIDTLLARYPNTVIVVVADHGEHFWEHGYLGHTVTLYEPLVHVLLFIKAPGLAPTTVDSLVETTDILPTIAALAGLPARPTWQGHDLFTSIEPRGPVFSCGKFDMIGHMGEAEMVRLDSMKLICKSQKNLLELYDLAMDPEEMTNLASTQPAITEQLMTLLYDHLRTNALISRSNGFAMSPSSVSSTKEGSRIALTAGSGVGHRWFRDGQLIAKNPPRLVGTNTSTLTINPFNIDDTGDYECVYHEAKTLRLQITDPFTLSENKFPGLKTLIASAFICVALVCIALAGFRLWKRASTEK